MLNNTTKLHLHALHLILEPVNELDQVWSQMLEKALQNARASGRSDVADYLSLKATNDAIRQIGVKWLLDTFIEIAGEANRHAAGIQIERQEPHNYLHRGSNMVGSLLRLRHGVRCLTVEAGWTRTPTDGFMRGGALAHARLTHFGMPKANDELVLLVTDSTPKWSSTAQANAPNGSEALEAHFRIFLG